MFDFAKLYDLHGHRCPMSTMGARIGLAAMSALGVTKADQFRVEGRYMTRNCALDGIQMTTGCTMGNGNLAASDEGAHAFVLRKRDGSRAVRVAVSPGALDRLTAHKKLKEELMREREISGLPRAMEIDREVAADFDRLITWVQEAPQGELVIISEERVG